MKEPWPKVELGEVLELKTDIEPTDSSKTYPIAGVYSFGRGLFARSPLEGTDTTYKYFHRLHKDDFVISQPKAWEGALARITQEFDGWFLSPVFPTFRAKLDKLEIGYLEWYCKQSKVWGELRLKSRGIGARRESVLPKQFLSLQIPLPSLPEQRRIVAKIEQLAAKIEEARGLRQQTGREIQAYISGILASIFDLNRSEYPFKTLGELCETTSGGTPSRERFDFYAGDIPWIKSGELEDCIITRADEHISEEALSASSAKLFPAGTLLVALYGATVGKTGVLGISAATNQAVCAIFPSESLNRDYVWWFLKRMRPVYLSASFGGAQPNISQKILRESHISVPPVSEQRRIVAYLDSLQAKVDRLKALQAQSAAELEALLPSILDRAFKGEL